MKRLAGRTRRKLLGKPEPTNAARIPTLFRVRIEPSSIQINVAPGWTEPVEEIEDPESSLAPHLIRRVLIWKADQDPAAIELAESLHVALFTKSKTTLAYVEEINPTTSGAPTMLDVVERIRPRENAHFLVRQSSLVIIQDPASNLPIAVAHTWPGARVILVLTRPPAFPAAELIGVEALLLRRDVELPADVLDVTPFHAEFDTEAELHSNIRALWNVARPYPRGHLSIIKGSADALGVYEPTGMEEILVAMSPNWEFPTEGITTFRHYLLSVWSSAQAVAIHSKFTYSYESLVSRADENLFMVLIQRGARVTFTTAAQVAR